MSHLGWIKGTLTLARTFGYLREVVKDRQYFLVSASSLETLSDRLVIPGVRLTRLQGNLLKN